jgi:hypothetical protein
MQARTCIPKCLPSPERLRAGRRYGTQAWFPAQADEVRDGQKCGLNNSVKGEEILKMWIKYPAFID